MKKLTKDALARREALAEAMRARRLRLGLTQAEVAKLAGMTRQRYHQLESGRYQLPATRVSSLAGALGVPAKRMAKLFLAATMPEVCSELWPKENVEIRRL